MLSSWGSPEDGVSLLPQPALKACACRALSSHSLRHHPFGRQRCLGSYQGAILHINDKVHDNASCRKREGKDVKAEHPPAGKGGYSQILRRWEMNPSPPELCLASMQPSCPEKAKAASPPRQQGLLGMTSTEKHLRGLSGHQQRPFLPTEEHAPAHQCWALLPTHPSWLHPAHQKPLHSTGARAQPIPMCPWPGWDVLASRGHWDTTSSSTLPGPNQPPAQSSCSLPALLVCRSGCSLAPGLHASG